MKRPQLDHIVSVIGVTALLAWVVDAVHVLLVDRQPSTLLWYSLTGLLLTGISLVWRNNLLVSSAFCALFIPEAIWSIGFFSTAILNTDIGIASYMRFSRLATHDTFISLYHLLIPAGLGLGLITQKSIHRYAWAGAAAFGLAVIGSTYLLVPPSRDVNCLWQTGMCRAYIPENYFGLGPGARALLAITGMTVFVYVPSYFLTQKGLQRVTSHEVGIQI